MGGESIYIEMSIMNMSIRSCFKYIQTASWSSVFPAVFSLVVVVVLNVIEFPPATYKSSVKDPR